MCKIYEFHHFSSKHRPPLWWAMFTLVIQAYRIPSRGASPRSLGLLEKLGFKYSSNMVDDVRPYRHPGMKLIELSVP